MSCPGTTQGRPNKRTRKVCSFWQEGKPGVNKVVAFHNQIPGVRLEHSLWDKALSSWTRIRAYGSVEPRGPKYPGRGKEIKDGIICRSPLIWPVQRMGTLSSLMLRQVFRLCAVLWSPIKHVHCMVNKTHNDLYQLIILVWVSHIHVSSSVFSCLACLVSKKRFRNIRSLYLGEGRKEIMLWWPFREADAVGWQWGEGDAGLWTGLKTDKGKWRKWGKVLEEIFLVFVTNSGGMLWWRTFEKRAPITWKQICKAQTGICHTGSQQVACIVHTGGCSGSPAPLLPGGEESNVLKCPLLISLVLSAIITQNLCPAVLKAVGGAIDSTINACVNQVRVYLDEQY